MRSISLMNLPALLFLACGFASFDDTASFAASPILVLNTKDLCQISVNGTRISDASLFGSRPILRQFLQEHAAVYVHSCEYLLTKTKLSEVDYIMQRFTRPAPATAAVPAATIFIQLSKPTEFLQLASAANLLPPPPAPPGDPPPTAGGPGGPGNNDQPLASDDGENRKQGCKVDEMCMNVDGSASMKLKCGVITVSASTSGQFTVGVSGSNGEFSVPFGAASEQNRK